MPPSAATDPRASRDNGRIRLGLFLVYLVFYGGFMAWNVVDPVSMAKPVLLGINLAIVYGFGLIVLAVVLALVYVLVCGRDDAENDR